jgi:hypothetical protein
MRPKLVDRREIVFECAAAGQMPAANQPSGVIARR